MAGRPWALLIALALISAGAEAQPTTSFDEVGRFYVQNFAPEDYGGHSMNWAVIQAENGLIYVGNSDGVLEYDGVSWRLIRTPARSVARSLAIDAEGRLFVGAVGEIGYLAPDSQGTMRYLSLLEHIPEEDRDFADVWKTHALPDGVYFQAHERLFRWQGGQMKVWRPQTRFNNSHALRDTLYLEAKDVGLLRMGQDMLLPAPGGANFAELRPYGLVPHAVDGYLAVTERGMFRCRGNASFEEACAPFSPGLTPLLREMLPYHASVLPDDRVAIATMRGVLLLDQAGQLLRILDQASGLRNENVLHTYVDRQGRLWLSLGSGLARVEVAAPMTYFDKTMGMAESVQSVVRHRGRLYVASQLGVSVLEPKAGDAPRFVAVPGGRVNCWSLLSARQGLLAGCYEGVYNLDQGRQIWRNQEYVFAMYRSRRDPTQLYLGLRDGLARLELRAGEWRDAGRIDGVRGEVRSIVEDARGRLWLGTPSRGVLRVEPAAASANEPAITRFGVEHGLPAGSIETKTVAGRMAFLSIHDAGLFRIDSQTGSIRFVPDTTFEALLRPGTREIDELEEDEQGKVWIVQGEASGVAYPSADGDYTLAPTALRRAPSLTAGTLYAEAGGPVWISGRHGLIRLDPEGSVGPSTACPVRIRRVTSSGDSLLYDGQPGQPGAAEPWPYLDNALRFAFAAPSYDAPERTHYRTRLDGFDRAATGDNWSAWSTETDKDYTNLWEGNYVFRVQARDVYGFVSREDSLGFRILPHGIEPGGPTSSTAWPSPH